MENAKIAKIIVAIILQEIAVKQKLTSTFATIVSTIAYINCFENNLGLSMLILIYRILLSSIDVSTDNNKYELHVDTS